MNFLCLMKSSKAYTYDHNAEFFLLMSVIWF